MLYNFSKQSIYFIFFFRSMLYVVILLYTAGFTPQYNTPTYTPTYILLEPLPTPRQTLRLKNTSSKKYEEDDFRSLPTA